MKPTNLPQSAAIRHQWKIDETCTHCGLQRKVVRTKTLVHLPGGRHSFRWPHKMVYSYDGFETILEGRPECIGVGMLTEEDYLPLARVV